VPWRGNGRRPRRRAPTLSSSPQDRAEGRDDRAGRRQARDGTSDGGTSDGGTVAALRELLDGLPDELVESVFTHSSWAARRAGSYERLAFLGDSVLSLAVTTHLYQRVEAERFGAGRLTKTRAQAVSGRSNRAVALRLGVEDRLRAAAPESAAAGVPALLETERVLAEISEAIIGACYLHYGYERTAGAVVEAYGPQIAEALERPVDYKSALQERLARQGSIVSYDVVEAQGPPHDPTFEISATVEGREVARGTGRSKKDAEQEAAHAALERLD
jgi:ribonuclease-3